LSARSSAGSTGVPKVLAPNQLRSALRPDRYGPDINTILLDCRTLRQRDQSSAPAKAARRGEAFIMKRLERVRALFGLLTVLCTAISAIEHRRDCANR
jgi:hypothetical protein